MNHDLANQEIARLRYAEALREAARRPIVEKPVEQRTHRIPRLLASARAVVARSPRQAPAMRPRPS